MKTIWTTLQDLLPLLPGGARRFLVWFVALTSALTVLDAVAMGILALVIAPVATGQRIVLPLFGSFGLDAAPILIVVACALVIIKSALQVLLQFIATRRMAGFEFEIGNRLFRAYLHSSWEERTKRSTTEITRIADVGIANATAGFILPIASLPGGVLTVVLVVGVLVVAQPLVALVALVYLALVAFVMNRLVARKTLEAAEVSLQFGYRVAIFMTEMVEALKEVTLRNRLGEVADAVARNRSRAVRARANNTFLQVLPVRGYEAALIGGFLVVGVVAYAVSGMTGAVSAVALFGATGFRLIPGLVTVQSGILTAIVSVPTTRNVIDDLIGAEANPRDVTDEAGGRAVPPGAATLRLHEVGFSYPGGEPVLKHLDLDIPLGTSLGIVGPSGAGKSTLIDILLGLSTPSVGTISIDGAPLDEMIHDWRSKVGYVPQRVALFDGTIGQNVALTWEDDYDRPRAVEALRKAQLLDLVESRPEGIDARIGERGMSLSGGQQQRLGIARALYGDPIVLVLDEATSSLDTKTEDDVTSAIRELKGRITLIAVAHRISTIKDYDQIAYLEDGRILGKDTFQRLAASLPQFGLQVQLAGLGRSAFISDEHDSD